MVFSTLPTSISSIRSPHSPVCLHPQRHQHPRARSSSRRFPSSWRKANRAEIAHRNLWAHIFLVHNKLNFEAFWKTHIRSEYINLVKQIESCWCSEWIPPIFLKQKSTTRPLCSPQGDLIHHKEGHIIGARIFHLDRSEVAEGGLDGCRDVVFLDYLEGATNANYEITGWWFQPLWKIRTSVRIMIPNIWKIKHVPNHQPGYIYSGLPRDS